MDSNYFMNYEYQPPKKSHKMLFIILGSIFCVLLITGILFFCFFKYPRFEQETYELGTEPPEDIEYYMFGSSVALKDGEVDISDVDYMTVGEYTVVVTVNAKDYFFDIEIEDTTAPKITVNNDLSNINIGLDYDLEAFCTGATDLAGPVEITTYQDDTKCEKFYFPTLGTYKIKICAEDINGNESKKEFEITAVDTIAPSIEALSQSRYYAVNDEYTLYDFISQITDNSGDFNVYYLVNDSQSFDTTIFSEKAQYKIEVIASDAQGNVNSYVTYVDADYKPEFYGATDKTIKINTEYNLLEGVFAWDNEEGFISDRVLVTGEVDAETEGDYSITYSVTDKNGLTKDVPVTISVSKNSFNTVPDYPDELITKMFEADAFQYDLLTDDDTDVDLATMMYPCQVAMDVVGVFKGSGFIYKIDEEYMYIGTAGHCIENAMRKEGKLELYVYNPTYDSKMTHNSDRYKLTGIVADDTIKIYSGSDDRGMFRIKLSSIPNYILVYLKEVNKTNESNINLNNGIYINTIYAARDFYKSTFVKELFVNTKTGPDYDHLLEYFSGYTNTNKWLITSAGTVPGQSGSLLYDRYGNPVASVIGRMHYQSASLGRNILFSTYAELYEKLSAETE